MFEPYGGGKLERVRRLILPPHPKLNNRDEIRGAETGDRGEIGWRVNQEKDAVVVAVIVVIM